uniref:Ig-like domain-containing protein n=1 Tax=Oreochromis niloticus TaxID=8128 RepID=A0A669CG12_ORENI
MSHRAPRLLKTCIKNAVAQSDDVVYLAQIYFNKVLMGQYNSTLGKYVGYTEKLKEHTRLITETVLLLPNQFEPTVKLRLVESPDSEHPGMLMCSAYNFYPKHIKLTWLRDGKEVTTDVTSTEELPNGNWLYQIHSHLEIIPKPGENISCMVEHASLMEPKFYDWEPSPDSGRDKIAVGAAGLLLGLVFSVAGLIYYKKKSSGDLLDFTEILVPIT